MKRLLLAALATASVIGAAFAADNYTVKDSTGATVTFRATDNTSVYLPMSTPVFSDGTGLSRVVTVDSTLTRPADHNAYAIGDGISAGTAGGETFTSACRASGGSAMITDIIITDTDDAVVPLQGRLWIFDQAATALTDNAALAFTDGEIATLAMEPISFTMTDVGNNDMAVLSNWYPRAFTCSGTANLRWHLEARNAYDPAANSGLIKVRLKIVYTN